ELVVAVELPAPVLDDWAVAGDPVLADRKRRCEVERELGEVVELVVSGDLDHRGRCPVDLPAIGSIVAPPEAPVREAQLAEQLERLEAELAGRRPEADGRLTDQALEDLLAFDDESPLGVDTEVRVRLVQVSVVGGLVTTTVDFLEALRPGLGDPRRDEERGR